MKRTIIALMICFGLSFSGLSYGQSFLWAKKAGEDPAGAYHYHNNGHGTAVSTNGSLYTCGVFSGSAVFGKNEANQTTLVSPLGYWDFEVYIAKYNADGTLAWAKGALSDYDDEIANGIAALPEDKAVIVGQFFGSITFGKNEPNETTLTSDGLNEIFIAKYNSDGALEWAKKAGGVNNDIATAAVYSPKDNTIIVTGYVSTNAIFGKGEKNQTVFISSSYYYDSYIAKYNMDGSLLWARYCSKTENGSSGTSVAVSTSGDIAIGGYYSGTAVFDAIHSITSRGYNDMFVVKYNKDGGLIWARSGGGSKGDTCAAVGLLSDGSVIATGTYMSYPYFGSLSLSPFGAGNDYDMYLVKYSTEGAEQWLKRAGGDGGGNLDDAGTGLAILPDGGAMVTGYFSTTSKFGIGEANETTLQTAGLNGWCDIFVARYKHDGTLLWVKKAGGESYDYSEDIAYSKEGNIYITGWFSGSITFGPGEPNQTILYETGSSEIFTAKYSSPLIYNGYTISNAIIGNLEITPEIQTNCDKNSDGILDIRDVILAINSGN